jgi:polysaccharide export outer membrane protein
MLNMRGVRGKREGCWQAANGRRSGTGGPSCHPRISRGSPAHLGRRAGLQGVLAFALVTLACGGPTIKELQPGEAPPSDWVFDPTFEYEREYRVRVGDELRIEFLSDVEPATNASRVIVRPDGRISLRGVDDVLAAGLTPAELDAALTEGFSRILVDPSLSVIIDRFSSRRVFVVGAVRNPREIPLVGPITLLKGIAAAGGFVLGANRNDVIVVRQLGGGRMAAFKVDTERIMENPMESVELPLRGQDTVIVPKTRIAKVGEFVQLYFRDIVNPALITVLTIDELQDRGLFFSN